MKRFHGPLLSACLVVAAVALALLLAAIALATEPDRRAGPEAQENSERVKFDPSRDRMTEVYVMSAKAEEKGTGPSLRKLKNESGVNTKELYQLFPKGPAKKAALIAGITKPQGCI